MKVPLVSLSLQMVVMFTAFMLCLFLPAGTLNWVPGWVFMAIFFGGGILSVIWLLKTNPALLNERLTGLGKENRPDWDKRIMAVLIPLYVVWVVVMPLDAVRFHWSHIPVWGQVVGGVIFVISYYLLFLTYRENSFLSPAIRIQQERGQTVISTGPYHYVRHPMYASFLLQFIGVSLLLGSWFGLLLGLLFTTIAARRAVLEENLLRKELPGYAEYMTNVRYRIIPYVW